MARALLSLDLNLLLMLTLESLLGGNHCLFLLMLVLLRRASWWGTIR